jgi:hypothetical protein
VIGLLKCHIVYLLPVSLRETLLGQSGVGAIGLKSAYCLSETLNLNLPDIAREIVYWYLVMSQVSFGLFGLVVSNTMARIGTRSKLPA